MTLEALVGLGLRVAGACLQFGFTVLVARFFGASVFGLYSLAFSLCIIASAIARWGMGQYLLRQVSVDIHCGDWLAVRRTMTETLIIVGLMSSVFGLLFWLVSPWLSDVVFSKPMLMPYLMGFSIAILPMTYVQVLAEGFRALGESRVYVAFQVVILPLLSLIFVSLISMADWKDGVLVVWSYVLACYVGVMVAIWFWHRRAGFDFNLEGFSLILDRLKKATPLAWVSIMTIAMSFIETLLLGVFHSPEDVAMYAAALRLALLVNFVVLAVNGLLAPPLASLCRDGKTDALESLVNRAILLTGLLCSPILLGLFLFPDTLLGLFGESFIAASSTLMILATGQIMNVISGPVVLLLQMSGHEIPLRNRVMQSAILALVSGLALIPSFGFVGAAMSATIGMASMNLLCLREVWVLLGVCPWPAKPFFRLGGAS